MIRLLFNFIFRTKRRWMTVQALVLSAVAGFRVRFYPPTRLHRYFGEKGAETPEDAVFTPEQMKNIIWVSDRVDRVANRTPWESKCLVRAMVAQRLLRCHGIASTLYLGVGRDESKKMIAHAWVRCGALFVTGGKGDGYATVARFRY